MFACKLILTQKYDKLEGGTPDPQILGCQKYVRTNISGGQKLFGVQHFFVTKMFGVTKNVVTNILGVNKFLDDAETEQSALAMEKQGPPFAYTIFSVYFSYINITAFDS